MIFLERGGAMLEDAFGLFLDISTILGICEHCEYCCHEFLNGIIIDLNGFCL